MKAWPGNSFSKDKVFLKVVPRRKVSVSPVQPEKDCIKLLRSCFCPPNHLIQTSEHFFRELVFLNEDGRMRDHAKGR